MQGATITYRRARNQGTRTLHLIGPQREERKARADLAKARLASIGADTLTDYHTLPASAVDQVLGWAKAEKYRKPRNANGSTGRYFFALLQRRAQTVY